MSKKKAWAGWANFTPTQKDEGKEKKTSVKHFESALQRQCVKWFELQHPHYMVYAIPNGGSRSKVEAKIMKGEGVLAAIPDLCIPVPKKGYASLYIEMKRPEVVTVDKTHKKGTVSPGQKARHEQLRSFGNKVEVAWTLDEFMTIVNEYLND